MLGRTKDRPAEAVVVSESGKLRELACWYREFAERTENPVIWDSRIRTAEDLEAEAARLEGGRDRLVLA
jgi:hypothetical protein